VLILLLKSFFLTSILSGCIWGSVSIPQVFSLQSRIQKSLFRVPVKSSPFSEQACFNVLPDSFLGILSVTLGGDPPNKSSYLQPHQGLQLLLKEITSEVLKIC